MASSAACLIYAVPISNCVKSKFPQNLFPNMVTHTIENFNYSGGPEFRRREFKLERSNQMQISIPQPLTNLSPTPEYRTSERKLGTYERTQEKNSRLG